MQVFTYWHNKALMPPYVKLCVGIMQCLCTSFRLYDRDSVLAEVPDIRNDIWTLRHGRGHHDAMRSDYIRNKILYKNGGFWLDADTLVVSNVAELFGLLDTNDYVGRRNEVGLIGINFIGSRPQGKIIGEYIKRQDALLDEWNEIAAGSTFGSRIVSEIVESEKEAPVAIMEESRICPINFKNWRAYFSSDIEIDKYLKDDTVCFQFYNRAFPKTFLQMTAQQILEEGWLISKLFKWAIEKAEGKIADETVDYFYHGL